MNFEVLHGLTVPVIHGLSESVNWNVRTNWCDKDRARRKVRTNLQAVKFCGHFRLTPRIHLLKENLRLETEFPQLPALSARPAKYTPGGLYDQSSTA